MIDDLRSQLGDRYELRGTLGQGGMATVYLAHDLKHHRSVAIKVLRPELAAVLGTDRFLAEIRTTAQLQHPNILPLYESGVGGGIPFFVSPFIEGSSLRDRLAEQRPLPVAEVLRVTRDVAAGLDFAHQHGVVHRDIKPDNILLQNGVALVADFGIALAVERAADSRLTGSGFAVGTPAYMSPEQRVGEAQLDGRSDVYSLGCVVFECLTGAPPSPTAGLVAGSPSAGAALRQTRPDLAPAVAAALERAMAADPAARFATAGEFAAALDRAETNGPLPVRRSRRTWVAITVLLVAGLSVTRYLTTTARAAVSSKDYVLLADVTADSADRDAAAALRSALEIGFQESPHVNLVPANVVGRTRAVMELPPTTPVVDSVARELAIRVGARAVIEPALRREDDRYRLVIVVRSPASNQALVERRAVATGIDSLVPVMTDVVARVRRDLGEKIADTERAARLEFVTTKSLDALRRFTEGRRAFSRADHAVAIEAFREAVALDSNFAMARKALGVSLYWEGRPREGDREFDRALALADRLTERERLLIAADVDAWRGFSDRAVVGYRRVLERYPNDIEIRRVMAYTLFRGGRTDEAIVEYRRMLAIDSLDPSSQINLAASLASQDRFREALPHYRLGFQLNPNNYRTTSLVHEFAFVYLEAGHSDSARALARRIQNDRATRPTGLRAEALMDLMDGRFEAAHRELREASLAFAENGNHQGALRTLMQLARLSIWLGRHSEAKAALRRALAVDPNSRTEWLMGIGARVALEAGDSQSLKTFATLAAELTDTVRPSSRAELLLTEATVALASGRPVQAAEATERADAIRSSARTQAARARALTAAGDTTGALRLYDQLIGQGLGGAHEERFDWLAAHLGSAELLLARGDSGKARDRLSKLLDLWRQGDSTNPMRLAATNRLAALTR